jgi:recombination protein RecA
MKMMKIGDGKPLSLTKRQRAIIVGMLLGDGHLETQNGGRTYRLKVEHSLKQREYVDWLYGQLRDWVPKPPKERKKISFGKMTTTYGFTTYSSGALRFYAHQFYSGKRKVIPKLIKKLLSPLALAIWFMDDGSMKSHRNRSYVIYTLGYTKRELALLQDALLQRFDIHTAVHKHRGGFRLYVSGASARKFRKLIEPSIVPSMRYKLGEHMPKR